VLEEIRLLSGVETTKEKVLRIILAGQPELNEKLDAPELIQLAQRIRLRFHLSTLSASEMRAYIEHRLEVAGAGDRQIFAEDTFSEIFRYTGGVPRLVNTLCDTAMMSAFASNRDGVTVGDVATAVDELRWVEFSVRLQQQQAAQAALGRGNMGADGHHTATATSVLGVAPGGTGPGTNGPTSAPSSNGPAAESSGPAIGRMLIATDGRTVQEVPLKVGRIIVGRTTDNDVQIDSRFVSRHHCQVITTPHACVIEDLNSTNGIYVKSKRVRRHYLNDGDVVQLGKHELIYIDERLPRVRAPFVETIPGAAPSETVGETH
jgi:hypothetical protein